ncbi:hypothetical protein OX284_014630 [Flavobacterium sp. SUN046]|uniref:hypothetical protein n=1 Tax=Flavobacterium sp. SUN046 TaxID=3002440 RepID=UPI002DBF1375|nr:hypothetical protein [Flavobacterium sp. SUN046]MEC4050672.1 hypothetical protein [Flavobacterium sp. SUN046]
MENTSNIKNYIIIGLVIALFLMTFQCHNSQGALAELEKDKTEISNADARISQLLSVNNNIQSQKESLIKDNSKLANENETLKKSISDHKEIYQAKEQKVKAYSKGDIASYFESRYNLPNSVKTTATGTEVSDTLAKATIKDLLSYDEVDFELSKTNDILSNTQKQLTDKDSLWKKTEIQLKNLSLISAEKDSIDNVRQNEIKQVEKQLHQEKLKKTFWKVASGVIFTTATYFLIK